MKASLFTKPLISIAICFLISSSLGFSQGFEGKTQAQEFFTSSHIGSKHLENQSISNPIADKDKAFMWVYLNDPICTTFKNFVKDMNELANPTEKNRGKDLPKNNKIFAGTVSKVMDLDFGTPPFKIKTYDEKKFYAQCSLKHYKKASQKIALINAPNNHPLRYSKKKTNKCKNPSCTGKVLATDIVMGLSKKNISNIYKKGIVLDMEVAPINKKNINTLTQRVWSDNGKSFDQNPHHVCDFFTTLIKNFNNNNMPVGIYVNPNLSYFTQNDANCLNKVIIQSNDEYKRNYYIFPTYDGAANNIAHALQLIREDGKNHPFKLLVEVSKKPTTSVDTQLASAEKYISNPDFKGIMLYQYAKKVEPSSDNISKVIEFLKKLETPALVD